MNGGDRPSLRLLPFQRRGAPPSVRVPVPPSVPVRLAQMQRRIERLAASRATQHVALWLVAWIELFLDHHLSRGIPS